MTGRTAAPETAPRLAVRMACAVYEGLLLFGVLAGAGLVYGLLVRPDGNANWGWPFYALELGVMAAYFSWFWSKGETLAMATWHLRLKRKGSDKPPSPAQALLRFFIAQLWWLPGLAALQLSGLGAQTAALWAVLGVNIAVYAALTRLHPSRQYLHDLLAGTEMVRQWRTVKKKPR